jgi:hypothetical protein
MALIGTWYAVGSNGQMRKYSSGSWATFTGPGAINLKCVWGSGPNNIWVGAGDGCIYYWNGATWTKQLDLTSSYHINDIIGVSATNIYAVANKQASAEWIVYHFDGATWNLEDTVVGNTCVGLWIDSNGRVYAVNNTGSTMSPCLRYKNSGGAWATDNTITELYGMTPPLTFICGPAANDVYLGGTHSSYDSEVRHGQALSWSIIYGPTNPGSQLNSGDGVNRGWHNNAWCDPTTGQIFACAASLSPVYAYCLHYIGGSWVSRHIGTTEAATRSVHGINASNVLFSVNTADKVAVWNGSLFSIVDIKCGGTSTGYVDVWGIDDSPPYTANVSPPSGATGVSISSPVDVDVLDDHSGVNEPTVENDLDGVAAWQAGAQQPGFTASESVITGGYRYHIVPGTPWGYNHHGTLRFRATDNAGNALDQTTTFDTIADLVAPYITNLTPADLATDISIYATISVDIVDAVSGVTEATVIIDEDGVPIWSGGAVQPGFSVVESAISGGFRYVITKSTPWAISHTVALRFRATDVAGNAMDITTHFTTSAFGVLTVVTPAILEEGGDLVQLGGGFPLGENFQVRFGAAGAADDPLCFGGIGSGQVVRSLDGSTIQFYAPPINARSGRFRVIRPSTGMYYVTAPIDVRERPWRAKGLSMALLSAPWKENGIRTLSNTPRL